MKCMRLRVSKLRVEGLSILGLKCRWFAVYGLRILPKGATSHLSGSMHPDDRWVAPTQVSLSAHLHFTIPALQEVGSTCHRDASQTVVWEPPTAKPKPPNPKP